MNKDEFSSRDYPIKENIIWLRRESLIQHIGEYILIAIVILGACGLFSKGFLSNGLAQSPDGSVRVEYERFGRVQSNMKMSIRIDTPPGGQFTVTIGSGALNTLQIQTLQPQPVQALSDGSDMRLMYSSHNTGESHTVWLGLQPQQPGRVAISVSVDNHRPVQFNQWIYP